MEYIYPLALIFIVWRVLSLSRELQDLKIKIEVKDRFVDANIDTLYKKTRRIEENKIQEKPIKYPFFMSLPSIGLYSDKELEKMKIEYDKKWEGYDYVEYKEDNK